MGTLIGPGPTGMFDWGVAKAAVCSPIGPIKRRGDWCYRDSDCFNTFDTVNCPSPLPPDLGSTRPGSDLPSLPNYGIVIAGLLIGGLWMLFGGRKN